MLCKKTQPQEQQREALHYIILYYSTSYHIISYHIMLYYIIVYYIILYYIILYCIIWHYIISYYHISYNNKQAWFWADDEKTVAAFDGLAEEVFLLLLSLCYVY